MPCLDALTRVIRPPAPSAERPDDEAWQSVESKLGTKLPVDYKEFITRYGTGAVDNFLWVFNPFSHNRYLNLLDAGKAQLDALRHLRYERVPYPLYPDTNGILPWGITDNGDVLYWLCKGDASNWLIVVNESRGPRWREFQLSTCEFLVALVTRELVVDVFPDDFPSESPEFVPTD
jgi:hypothetical protein